VHNAPNAAEEVAERQTDFTENFPGVQDAFGRVRRCRKGLLDSRPAVGVDENAIGKGPANIDADRVIRWL
jgi:hypothetical protein